MKTGNKERNAELEVSLECKEKLLYFESGGALEQIVQKDWVVSFSGDFQHVPGHVPV